MNRTLLCLAFAWMLAAAGLGPATAAENAARLGVELNKLEAQSSGCRAYLLLENGAGHGFSALKLDLVMFDVEGIVAKRLAVEAAPLPRDKISLKVFDIAGLACDRIGRLLLNDVLACEGDGVAAPDCLSLLAVRSRGDVPFVK